MITQKLSLRYLILITYCFLAMYSNGQDIGRVSKGSIGIGLHLACPQNQLSDVGYNDGFGLHLSYLSQKYPYRARLNYQIGVQLDWGNMGNKSFNNIALDDPNIVGEATIDVNNKMFGSFIAGRINYGNDNSKIVPYINLLVGYRNFNTRQLLSLNNPADNPDYQTDTTTNRIVFTQRFHIGGGFGVSYRINRSISLEGYANYTFGQAGAVLPIKNITRPNEGNEISYTDYKVSHTDMLLLSVGIRFHLFKTYRYLPYVNQVTNPSFEPSYTRYRDKENTSTNNTTNNHTPPKTKKKSPIKIKPNGPTKDKEDES